MLNFKNRNRNTINLLKAIYFNFPEWTPCEVNLMPATWMKYREDLEDLVLSHPRIFPDFKKGSRDYDEISSLMYEIGEHKDNWGCVWGNIERGMTGIPITHPLEDWAALEDFISPDPLVDDLFGPRDWNKVRQSIAEAKKNGNLASCKPLPHGFLYLTLTYLRGFENAMLDIALNEPHLLELISIIDTYNNGVVDQYIQLGMEYPKFGEDLGMQTALLMSPKSWRKYIKPSYARMFKPCIDMGMPVFLHSDGRILDIIPDLIEIGVNVLNPQFRSNGLDGLQEVAKGKITLCQDLDRQLFPYATPSEIEDHIGETHEALYLPEGGLILSAECEPDVPLENIEAICVALEKICELPEL